MAGVAVDEYKRWVNFFNTEPGFKSLDEMNSKPFKSWYGYNKFLDVGTRCDEDFVPLLRSSPMYNIGYIYESFDEIDGCYYVGQSSKMDEYSIQTYKGSTAVIRNMHPYRRSCMKKSILGFASSQPELDYFEFLSIVRSAQTKKLYNKTLTGQANDTLFLFIVETLYPEFWKVLQSQDFHVIEEFLVENKIGVLNIIRECCSVGDEIAFDCYESKTSLPYFFGKKLVTRRYLRFPDYSKK